MLFGIAYKLFNCPALKIDRNDCEFYNPPSLMKIHNFVGFRKSDYIEMSN